MSKTSSLRCLITAGPTQEFIDPVRFISNPSTGKMGFALAQAALKQGWSVDLVSGPVNLQEPDGAILYPVCLLYTSPSPRDMRRSRMPSSA